MITEVVSTESYRLRNKGGTIDAPIASFDGSNRMVLGHASVSMVIASPIVSMTITSFLTGDGTAALPAVAVGSTNLGLFRPGANTLGFASAGLYKMALSSGTLRLDSTHQFGFTSSDASAALDTILVRDAANTLALKNGTAAQELRIYGTTTGPKYLRFSHDGTDARISTTGSIIMGIGSTYYWVLASDTFAFRPATDNQVSIGELAIRASNVFSVIGTFGTTSATAGTLRIGSNQYLVTRDSGNAANRNLIGMNGIDQIEVGTAAVQALILGTSITLQSSGVTGAVLDSSQVFNVIGGYKINGVAGITTTVTTGTLVGKTITITNGLVTGFA